MHMLLYTVLPDVVPLSTPIIPNVEVSELNGAEVWWIENTRSEWIVVEDCWRSDLMDERWWSLEPLMRTRLSSVSSDLMVSSDLEWLTTGFCLRIEGLSMSVMEARDAYLRLLWKPLESREINDIDTQNFSVNEPVTLRTLHEDWLYSSYVVPRIWVQKRIWNNFVQNYTHRVVLYSPHKPEISNWISETKEPTSLQWLPTVQSKEGPNGTCLIQDTSTVSQMAVTIQVYFEDLSNPEMRILNSILGSGVRSRLSQRLREELGLVYTIGSRFTGGFIEVSYTVDPVNFSESLLEVEGVLYGLSSASLTTMELQTARSMFLLRQYTGLEDSSTMVRMMGRFNSPKGWSRYIHSTLQAVKQLNKKSISISRIEKRITGPVSIHHLVPMDCEVHSVRIR